MAVLILLCEGCPRPNSKNLCDIVNRPKPSRRRDEILSEPTSADNSTLQANSRYPPNASSRCGSRPLNLVRSQDHIRQKCHSICVVISQGIEVGGAGGTSGYQDGAGGLFRRNVRKQACGGHLVCSRFKRYLCGDSEFSRSTLRPTGWIDRGAAEAPTPSEAWFLTYRPPSDQDLSRR